MYDTYLLDVTEFPEHHPGGAHLITSCKSSDIGDKMAGHFPLTLKLATSMSIGTMEKEIKEYIDRDAPILPQIWNIDHDTYQKIIHLPHWIFSISPKMFATPFIESYSYCKWYHIGYVPFAAMLIYYYTYVQYHWHQVSLA